MKFKRMVLGLMLVFFLMVFSPVVSQGAVTNAKVTPVINTNKNAYTVGEKIELSTPTTKAGYKYKFVWSKDNWKEWGVISDFSFNSKASYMLKKAGTYDFYLDVRDNFGNTFSTNKKVNVAPLKPIIKTDKDSYTVGEKVNILTPTTGEGYKYKFVWSRDNWKEWGVISNFSFNSKASYMLKKAGTYDFYVDVRDNFGNTFSVNKKVNVAPLKPIINTDKNSYTVGDKVNISTLTTGEGYKYKFVWSKDNWKEWGVISNFSFNSKASYMLKKAGTYDFYLDVRDNFGNTFSTNKKVTVNSTRAIDVWNYVNEYRKANGRAPLTLDPELNKLAQIRAEELATMPKLEHKRPDGRDWKTVFAEYNVSRIRKGENIAWGSQYSSYATARGVTDGWIKSPGHRENILRPQFGRIGIGYAYVNGGHYWAQIFSD